MSLTPFIAYIYHKGDGIDTIYDTRADNNIFRFDAGIDQSQIKLRLGSLVLDLGDGDLIHINNEDQANANGFDQNDVFNSASIGSFESADGTTLMEASNDAGYGNSLLERRAA